MLLRHCLDAERHTTAADDDAIRQARSAAYRTAPYWPFAQRTPTQELIQHPAKHVRSPIRRANREQ